MARKGNAARKEAPAANQSEQKFPTTAELEAQGFASKSARIRELHRLGMKTGDIARQETNGLYQHAYNVIKRPVKGRAAPAAPAQPASSETSGAETDTAE